MAKKVMSKVIALKLGENLKLTKNQLQKAIKANQPDDDSPVPMSGENRPLRRTRTRMFKGHRDKLYVEEVKEEENPVDNASASSLLKTDSSRSRDGSDVKRKQGQK